MRSPATPSLDQLLVLLAVAETGSFSAAAKRLAASAMESPESSLRIAGIASAVIGLVLIWLVRG